MDVRGVPKLTMLTFSAWEKAMTLALMAEGCMEIVNGIEDSPDAPLPLQGNPTPEEMIINDKANAEYRREYRSFTTRSGKAAWMISQTLGEGIDSFIKDTNDPFVMWGLLKDAMDTRGNPVHQRAIRKRFSDLVHDGKGTIDDYISKLKGYQRAMFGTDDPISDTALVNKIVTTLPKEWNVKLRAIEDDEDLDLTKLERILRNYQVVITSEKIDNIALAAKGKRGPKGKKTGGKPVDRRVTEGRVSKDKDKDIDCWYCLQIGHYKVDCPIRKEVRKRAEDRKAGKKDKANIVEEVEDIASGNEEEKAFMAKHYSYESPANDWVLDSGATGHMCHDRQAFESLRRLPSTKKVILGDDTEVGAYGIGTVRLTRTLVLDNVLYIPDFTVNLCSVSKLATQGYVVTFEEDSCTIARNGQVVIRGKGQGLYVLQDQDTALMATDEARKEKETLWHQRLGHLHMAGVRSLEKMAKGIAIRKEDSETGICVPCVEGKHHKVYRRHEPATRMTRRLEMVHSDSCGPFRTPSKAKAKSFVLFTDDFSRMVWCFFLKSKTETTEAFKEFKALTEKHSGEKILRFRCDNGKAEYDNSVFRDFLKINGISYEPSAPYTQNQNGVSERMNRTIMEKARSMLIEACLPESFWAEAVSTAVYLHNRSPTRSLEGITPYEAWNGVKPDLSHLRVFGCDAYLHVPDQARTKLEPKSKRCIHLGYAEGTTKLWRLWDIAGQRVVRGANVRFNENSWGGRKMVDPPGEKPAPEIIDPFQMSPNFEGSEPMVTEDEPEGRFATGTPMGLVKIVNARLDPGLGASENEDSVGDTGEGHNPRVSEASEESEDEVQSPGLGPRRSTRLRTETKRFPGMRAFAARIGKDGEPVTYREALAEHPTRWQKAIADEYLSHKENGTWTPADLPPGKKALSSKWVFKNKTNADGTIRHKARLVVRGFEQREGIDFKETFAPVAKFPTVRIMLALATHFDWETEMMDVKTAFLYPEIEDEVYIAIPEGYHKFHPRETFKQGVFRLLKTLYGLRQSPLAWYKKVDSFLRSKGLIRSNEDSSLYISKDLIVILFVDDILLFASDKATILKAKGWLTSEYKMTDLGELKQFLGMQIERDRKNRTMFICQTRYFNRVLEQCKMHDCKGCKTPMDPKINLTKPSEKDIVGVTEYKSLIGSIMYGMLGTRPDLGYAISTLSKFNDCPAMEHHAAAKRVIRYLQHSKDYGLVFSGKDITTFPEPVCYTDSDWAGDKESRKSTGGYVITLGGGAVSWKTKRQNVVALSSTEAEYIALSEATKEAVWLRRILREIESRIVTRPELTPSEYHEEEIVRQWEPNKEDTNEQPEEPDKTLVMSKPQIILADNQGCIKMTENVYGNTKAKHIEIRYHYIRDAWQANKIKLQYEPTKTMTADIMTKALPKERHWELTEAMGVKTWTRTTTS